MLVSNYADAQREAMSLGALPGFGKAGLNDASTNTRLQEILGKT
jgi:two-component system chemotaxis response regulator CheY